jgi:hypothetical protein
MKIHVYTFGIGTYTQTNLIVPIGIESKAPAVRQTLRIYPSKIFRRFLGLFWAVWVYTEGIVE